MQQKSNIQLIKESIEKKNKRLNNLINFTESYKINDGVFTYNNNDDLYEIEHGYFESIMSTDNLKTIIENYKDGYGIRIQENNYQLGKLSNSILNIDNINNVLEINNK